MSGRSTAATSRILGVTVCVGLVVLTACTGDSSDEEPSDGVLTTADLPVEPASAEPVDTVPALTDGCAVSAESGMSGGPNDVWAASFDGVDGADVTSAVFSLAYWGERGDNPAGWLEWLAEAVGECAAAGPTEGTGWEETVTVMDGLDGDSYGYSVVRTGSEPFSGSRAYAPVEDVLVQVSVYHQGEGEPSVAAADLLDAAVERAEAEFGNGQ